MVLERLIPLPATPVLANSSNQALHFAWLADRHEGTELFAIRSTEGFMMPVAP